MIRTVLKVLCIVSGILFSILSIFLIISAVQVFHTANTASVGIIGGADGPTAIFLAGRIMRTPVFCTMVAAFLSFGGTGLALLFTKKSKST